MKVIYLIHKYSSNPIHNSSKMDLVVQQLIKKYPNHVFIFPPHSMERYFNDLDHRGTIMAWDKELLSRCDELWICCSKYSKGMLDELRWAKKMKKPIRKVCNEIS